MLNLPGLVGQNQRFEVFGQRPMRDVAAELVAEDWLVLRFGWNQVMARSAWVREMIAATVQLREQQPARRGRVRQLEAQLGVLAGV